MPNLPAPAKPSASVVIIRDSPQAPEVLLVQRNQKVVFHGGAWVFPGGRVDASDATDADTSELAIAKRAAVRETHEEAGLRISGENMLPLAHWTTPVDLPKRFATWFFATIIEDRNDVRIDNSEIVDFRWLSADMALKQHLAGEMTLPGPAYVTLLGLRSIANIAEMDRHLRATEIQHFVPRLVEIDEGRCALYHEDAGYAALDKDAPGPRHRLVMRGNEWDYIREF